jgi:hypothetical protein
MSNANYVIELHDRCESGRKIINLTQSPQGQKQRINQDNRNNNRKDCPHRIYQLKLIIHV